jgi:putative salt-induced outer membrane protein
MKKIVFILLLLFSCAYAEDFQEILGENVLDDENTTAFKVHVEMGYNQTTGNTQTQNFSADGKVTKKYYKHNFELVFDGQYASDDNNQTKNKYKIVGDYLYQMYERYSFGYTIGYKKDHFSGYDYQAVTGPLMKYKAIISNDHNLSFDFAALYSQDQVQEDLTQTPPVYEERLRYFSLATALDYEWQILENLKFSQYASYRNDMSESNRYFIFSKTAIANKISEMFSLGISYKVDYVSEPPEGKENTDTTFALNLIMDY